MVAPQPRGGEISNFRHLLGLDSGQQTKPRTMKDSKEIMKKRRERAICIVSTVLNIFFTSMLHVLLKCSVLCWFHMFSF